MIFSLEELVKILYWGYCVDLEYGLSEYDKILLDKIYEELKEMEVI